MENKTFTLIKKIAKHDNQAIIVIPKLIESSLKPGTIVEIKNTMHHHTLKGVV